MNEKEKIGFEEENGELKGTKMEGSQGRRMRIEK